MKYTASANISTVAESIIIQKFRGHFALDENTTRQYYRAYGK